MRYTKINKDNIGKEVKKAMREGRTTDAGMMLYLSLDGYPAIQKQIAKAFGIYE